MTAEKNTIATWLRVRALLAPTAALCLMSPALAQDPAPIEISGEVTVVSGAVDGDVDADIDALISAMGSTVLENGIEIGAAASVRADSDAPVRLFSGGRYSSALIGGPRGFGGGDGDVFLEGAYLFARGGFGSVHVGRDSGIASRLAVTAPTIFQSIGVNDWRTDLTGLNDVHTVNDFSGQSTKITYMPPAGLLGGVIGQFQLGLSFAPELGTCGDAPCAPFNGFATTGEGALVPTDQSWRDVVETAVYYQNGIDLLEEPLTVGFSASYVQADEEPGTRDSLLTEEVFGDYRAYAFGLNLAYGNLTLGGSFKTTNAGLYDDRDEDYLAFDAGLTYEVGEWNFMLGYGQADAERDAQLLLGPAGQGPIVPLALDRQTQTAQAGISYVFDHGVTLGAAAQFVDSDKADALGGPEEATAIMFESSIEF